MEKIHSFEDIQGLIKKIRDLRKGFITNFYPEPFRISLWCKYNNLFYKSYEESVLFIRQNGSFAYLFYCSSNIEMLNNDLTRFLSDYLLPDLVVDLVGNKSINGYKQIFISNGFTEYTSLVRMSKTGPPILKAKNNNFILNNAVQQDIPYLLALYTTYFDCYSEQIPYKEELVRWIDCGHIIVCRVNDRITGFLIYDLIGITLYLRYWFVYPKYREYKIGSALFHEFLRRGKDSKRQLFWVIESNENAIKRYIHYGFYKEDMFDNILIKRKNETENNKNFIGTPSGVRL